MTRRCGPLAVLVLLAVLAGPASATAAPRESTFQDDDRLLYAAPARVRSTLDQLAALGVDRLRLTVVWAGVAPDPQRRARPAFDAKDPAAYPAGAWDKFDRVIREATARGMGVNLNLTAPAPLWATPPPPRPDIADTYDPSPQEFGAFVSAIGRRYSGAYAGLPRVRYWSIWNEPNQSGWLTPQFADAGGGRFVEAAPRIYRGLLDAAYGALRATGHTKDTILFGDTAPKGSASRNVKRFMKPLVFLRALYCVDSRLRPVKGRRARDLGCEPKGEFAARHPALFRTTGYAHHPYELLLAPHARQKDPDYVTLAQIGRLTGLLDGTLRAYGVRRRLPLYLTEYGYQTDPPDEISGVSPAQQARYLAEGEYLAGRNPRVRTLAQFLLVDGGEPVGKTFQSGLRFIDGRAKPALAAYRLPLWVAKPTVSRPGRSVSVWGLLRSAAPGPRAVAEVQLRSAGSKTWRRVKTVRARDARGTISTSVRLQRSGSLRIVYGATVSRPVAVRVR